MMKSFAVVFAGVPGVSKTPIAHYLSCEFGLPIFSTDQIRYEVREDARLADINEPGGVEEYKKRRDERLSSLLASDRPFILDGSMDRRWGKQKQDLANYGYGWFMISMELSRPFLSSLLHETGRSEWAEEYLDSYLKQHDDFINEYRQDINVQITDRDFPRRLKLAADDLRKFSDARHPDHQDELEKRKHR